MWWRELVLSLNDICLMHWTLWISIDDHDAGVVCTIRNLLVGGRIFSRGVQGSAYFVKMSTKLVQLSTRTRTRTRTIVAHNIRNLSLRYS